MRHPKPSKPSVKLELGLLGDQEESSSVNLLHSALLASVKVQLAQLMDEAIDAFAQLDVAEGHRKSAAVLESLARLEVGALEALAVMEETNKRDLS